MKYKAIGFDYGGVIKGLPGSFFSMRVCELLGVTKEKWSEAYFHHNKKINRGDITWPELWQLVLSKLGQPDKVDEVTKISDEVFNQPINQPMLSLVDRLRSNGYKVGLLSNNTLEAAKKMRGQGLDRHFDVLHVSAETKLVKPEPEAFAQFARDLEVEQKELVFIDDAEKSLSTARECGFTPIQFKSYDKLIDDLQSLGIEI